MNINKLFSKKSMSQCGKSYLYENSILKKTLLFFIIYSFFLNYKMRDIRVKFAKLSDFSYIPTILNFQFSIFNYFSYLCTLFLNHSGEWQKKSPS